MALARVPGVSAISYSLAFPPLPWFHGSQSRSLLELECVVVAHGSGVAGEPQRAKLPPGGYW